MEVTKDGYLIPEENNIEEQDQAIFHNTKLDSIKQQNNKITKSTEQILLEEIRGQYKTNLLLKKGGEATELLVNYIKKKEYIYTTRDDIKSEMWIYRNGIYTPQGRTYVKEHVRSILQEVYTEHKGNEVVAKIETDTYTDAKNFFNNNIIEEICIENGILDIFTKKLTEHTPNKIFFNKLPIYYDETAECPNIKQHLRTVLKNETDIPVIQELIGYLLLKDSKFEKAFMFVGTGRNGKSKTLEIIKNFVGPESCSSVTLKELENPFSKCELFNKLVNIAGDISNDVIKDSSWFKGLTGRDFIGADRKFLTKLYFTNYAKLMFSANELPKTYDISPAFWNRWIILEFPYVFKSQKEIDYMPVSERLNVKLMDEDITKSLLTRKEMSGLLNWSLEGLNRLLTQKDFSYSKSVSEVRDFWIRKSDSFMAFCLDELEMNGEQFIEKKVFRQAYNSYCKMHKIKSQGDKAIKNTFDIHFGVMEDRKSFHNDFFHVWDGISFKKGSLENCKTCQGCHGFSNAIGKNNSLCQIENGGNPDGNQAPPTLIAYVPVQNIDTQKDMFEYTQFESIMLEKSNGYGYDDVLRLGFSEKQIEDWKGEGLIFESPNGIIRLVK